MLQQSQELVRNSNRKNTLIPFKGTFLKSTQIRLCVKLTVCLGANFRRLLN